MSGHLAGLRAQIASVEPHLRAPLAVDLAESDPLLGHRSEVTRDLLRQAGAALDLAAPPVADTGAGAGRVADTGAGAGRVADTGAGAGRVADTGAALAELQARLLLRLAALKMGELDWDAADQALTAAGGRVGQQGPLMFLVAARACRVAVRRGDQAVAGAMLRRAAAHVAPLADPTDPRWRWVLTELTIGIAEVAIHDDPGDPAPFTALRELVDELRTDPRAIDAVFTARQLLATDALGRGDAAAAALQLREVVRIAHDHDSPADEVEARLARGAALVARGDRAGAEEAERVIQIARDRALEHGLTDLHVAALIGQAGLMSQRGKTAGALDRCLEIARTAVAGGDLGRYLAAVGLMAQIYQNHGDYPSAYRTIAESYHALREVQGDGVKPMFTPLLETLRERMGAARFATMVDDVSRARRLADELTRTRAQE